jgi:hypothetical protein
MYDENAYQLIERIIEFNRKLRGPCRDQTDLCRSYSDGRIVERSLNRNRAEVLRVRQKQDF